MNILQVISSSRTSGAEKHLVVLSECLRSRGHRVIAVCPPGGWLPDQLRQAGVPALELPMHGPGSAGAILKLRQLAREHGADVIHTHLTRATYLGYFAGALARIPVISTVHVLSRDFAYRWLPRANHSFVTVSDHLRDRLIARGVSAGRVHTVHNGTDVRAHERRRAAQQSLAAARDERELSVRAELGLPAGAEVVGQVARVDTFKGAHLLVGAAKEVVAARPRAYFVFVGHAEPRVQQALWEMASADGVDDRLRFTGVRNDVPRMLRAMDVVTLPSINEECSMAIIEAMTVGKPVIATRAGGNLELVADGETGLLVERRSDALATAIVQVLGDPDRRKRMGRQAQARARAHFSAQAMARNIEGVYRTVVQN